MLTMWRISLVILICFFAGQAYSNPPSPTPPKSEQKNQADTKDKQPPASADQRGTDSSPVFIKVVPTMPVEPSPSKHTQQANWYTSPEWWLVLVTIILAGITAILAAYTGKLWGATKALAEEARQTATEQAADMKASLSISKQAANAAEQNANIANKSLSLTQRAYVFGKGFIGLPNITDDGITAAFIKEYVFWVDWENVGNTPATHVESWINVQTFSKSIRQEPMFQASTDTESSFVLGPRAKCKSAYHTIPLATMIECWSNQTSIYIWGKIEYRDIFNPEILHYHEQCSRISLVHEPSTIPPKGSIYLQFGAYGPQNGHG